MFDPDLIEADQAYLERAGLLKHTNKIIDPTDEIKEEFGLALNLAIIEAVTGVLPPSPYPPIRLTKSEADGL